MKVQIFEQFPYTFYVCVQVNPHCIIHTTRMQSTRISKDLFALEPVWIHIDLTPCQGVRLDWIVTSIQFRSRPHYQMSWFQSGMRCFICYMIKRTPYIQQIQRDVLALLLLPMLLHFCRKMCGSFGVGEVDMTGNNKTNEARRSKEVTMVHQKNALVPQFF